MQVTDYAVGPGRWSVHNHIPFLPQHHLVQSCKIAYPSVPENSENLKIVKKLQRKSKFTKFRLLTKISIFDQNFAF